MPTHPKLLPWLARRAGVSTDLAEKLWRRAVSDAAELAGSAQGSDFHRFAIDRFIDLLDDECNPEPTDPAFALQKSDWFWRYQRRMAAHSFKIANLGNPAWQRFWKQFNDSAMIA